MSHHHDDNCGQESHDSSHNHDHTSSGPHDNLFTHIDRSNVVALNTCGAGPEVIKPWHERLDEEKSLQSDADDQMQVLLMGITLTGAQIIPRIIRIPFTGSVKLRSLLLKAGPTDQTPEKVALFANEASLDFEDVADKTPTQEFSIAQGREVGEYALKMAKFSNVSSITLFFPEAQGAETTQIYYVGLLGHWTERKSNPVIAVYETQPNLADHEKIQGTDGSFSSPHI